MSSKRLRIVLGIMVGIWLIWKLFSGADEPSRGEVKHLTNRVWFERLPRDPRDLTHQLTLFQVPRTRLGAAVLASTWRMHADAFRYKLEGDRVDLEFPQENLKLSFVARTWRCKGEAPKPFDLCLELSGSEGKFRMYSREEWRLRDDGTPEDPESVPAGYFDPSKLTEALADEPTSVDPQKGLPRWFQTLLEPS